MVFGKRIDKPGGSRRTVRHDIMNPTAMMTMTDRISVDLLDLSKCGAKVRGKELPALGQEVLILVGRLEAFASIFGATKTSAAFNSTSRSAKQC